MGLLSKITKEISRPVKQITKEIERVGESVVDEAERLGKDIAEEAERFGEDVSDEYKRLEDSTKELLKDIVSEVSNLTDEILNAIDDLLESIGIKGSMKFLIDLNAGLEVIAKGIIDGNREAIQAGLAIAAAIVVTVVSMGTMSGFSASIVLATFNALGPTAAMAVYSVIMYSPLALTLVSSSMQIAMIGEYSTNFLSEYTYESEKANIADMWFGGDPNLWMAGGLLYDAPRAGDLMFNETGNLTTRVFLGLEDINRDEMFSWRNDGYHEFNEKIFSNLAGDPFFQVKNPFK